MLRSGQRPPGKQSTYHVGRGAPKRHGVSLISKDSRHLASFSPASSVVPIHGFLRLDPEFDEWNCGWRIPSLSHRVAELIVKTRVITQPTALFVGSGCNEDSKRLVLYSGRALFAEYICIRATFACELLDLLLCSSNGQP